jgi:hypothetical protein
MKKFRFKNIIGIVAMMAVLAGFASCSKSGGSASRGGKASPASDFEFTFNDTDNTVTITKYSGKGGKVVIPAEIEGYPVVKIANYAFAAEWTEIAFKVDRQKYNDAVARVKSQGRTSNYPALSDYEFQYTEETLQKNQAALGITDVTIPDTVTEIGLGAFRNCKNLVSVTLQGSVQFGLLAFSGCSKIAIATRQTLKEAGYDDGF